MGPKAPTDSRSSSSSCAGRLPRGPAPSSSTWSSPAASGPRSRRPGDRRVLAAAPDRGPEKIAENQGRQAVGAGEHLRPQRIVGEEARRGEGAGIDHEDDEPEAGQHLPRHVGPVRRGGGDGEIGHHFTDGEAPAISTSATTRRRYWPRRAGQNSSAAAKEGARAPISASTSDDPFGVMSSAPRQAPVARSGGERQCRPAVQPVRWRSGIGGARAREMALDLGAQFVRRYRLQHPAGEPGALVQRLVDRLQSAAHDDDRHGIVGRPRARAGRATPSPRR